MNKRVAIVVVTAITFVLLVIMALFEIKNIPDYRWKKNYDIGSKEPYGSWVFKEMLEERFSGVSIVDHLNPLSDHGPSGDRKLYVVIGSYIDMSIDRKRELLDFLEDGNQALIISGNIDISGDSTFYSPLCTHSIRDTTINVRLDNGKDYQFTHYGRSLNHAQRYIFKYHGECEDDDLINIGYMQDSFPVFTYANMANGGCMYFYSLPELFSNIASKQAFYLDHFNAIFSRFEERFVILEWYDTAQNWSNSSIESPLEYILSQTPLRSSYYTLLASLLLFVVFRGKRKQKAIPILPKNENTSLEYVSTLSYLFKSQNQNDKLIHHMKDIFANTVRKKYFLDYNDPDFTRKLARKSKLPEAEIDIIVRGFKNAENHFNFSDDQLERMSSRLDTFYKNCE